MISLSQITANGNPWLAVFNAVNSVLGYFGTDVVTANNSTDGAVNSGNGFVTGTFGSTILVANTIRGGTVNTVTSLSIVSNTTINSAFTLTNGNTSINSTSMSVGSDMVINTTSIKIGSIRQNYVNVSTSGTSVQTVDALDISTVRSSEYCLTVTDQGSSSYQVSKILLVHNGTTAQATEYGVISTNNQLGYFTATTNATHALLQITPTPSATTIKGHKVISTV